MERKEKKSTKTKSQKPQKAASPNNDDHSPKFKFWPDLPHPLVQKISCNPMLMRDISYKGVTKSWRAESKSRCNSPNPIPPSLHHVADNHHIASFNIRFKRSHRWYFLSRQTQQKDPIFHFLGSSHGHLVTKPVSASDSDSNRLQISTPMEWSHSSVPAWDASDPFLGAFLSSPLPWDRYPNNRCPTICTVIVLTGISHPAFAFYKFDRIGTEGAIREWKKQDCFILDPNCSRRDEYMRFINGIWFRGKFYALSLEGTLAVIEEIDSGFGIAQLGKKRAVPSEKSVRFKECLVESDGEILLVFLISRKSACFVDHVEVYSLDTAKLGWIEKNSLGDRTLCLGSNCCTSVSASRVGCRGDCVYFSGSSVDDDWWVFDMEKGIISPGAEDPTSFGIGCGLPRVIKKPFTSKYVPFG